jgi:hypothetical protein
MKIKKDKDTIRVNFDLDITKHLRFKTKATAIGSDITTELTKFVDSFIGKLEKAEKLDTLVHKSATGGNYEINYIEKKSHLENNTKIIDNAEIIEVSTKQEVLDKLKKEIKAINPENLRKTEIIEKPEEYINEE